MAPILTTIEGNMKSLIEGMTRQGGYNFDWGTVNEHDAAVSVFPTAQIVVTAETNNDPEDGAHANAYENDVDLEILVTGELTTIETDPTFSINTIHNKAVDDLKKLFGAQYTVNDSGATTIMYTGHTREIDRTGDIFRPGRIITAWRVSYVQDRTNVETVAS